MTEYTSIIATAKQQGYRFYTLGSFRALSILPAEPFIILRHDMDTNPAAACVFAEVEERFGAKASYFFRRCTWNPRIMNMLNRRGHEVGYHYEEITDFAKAEHIKSLSQIMNNIGRIKEQFAYNLANLRLTVDFDLTAVASHGDFAWKRLSIGNDELLKDHELRARMGVEYEVYDDALMQKYGLHISDKPAPESYHPKSPQEAIAASESFLFLSHPRWWIPDALGNLNYDFKVNYQKLLW
jgi:hypothetical protein